MSLPRPAATVLLLREGSEGPEVLLMQRARTVGFFPNAWVFPGGRVDEADRRVPVVGCDDPELGAFVAAAARECLEEAGIWLGVGGQAEALRRRLAAGHGRVDAEELRVDATNLPLWAWWITPPEEPRRYDTRFLLARLPVGAGEGSPDGAEATRLAWLSPGAALRAHAQGQLSLAPPTWCILDELSGLNSVAEAFARCRRRRPRPVEPRLVGGAPDAAGPCVLLPGDEQHPEAEARFRFSRLNWREGRWCPEARFRSRP